MKRNIAIFLVLLALVMSVASVSAATTHTVATNCTGQPSPCYTTIQAAITAAISGDTINVKAGTYVENLTVNKSLTFTGPNVGQRGQWDRVAEAIIEGEVTITVPNVTIDGFTVTNPGGAYGIYANKNSGATEYITIRNNIIKEVGDPGLLNTNVKGVYFHGGPDHVVVTDNWFDNITSDNKSVNGLYFGDSNATDLAEFVEITNNYFSNISSNWGSYGILLNSGVNVGGGVPGVLIERNIFDTIDGVWTHAIGLETDTPNAVLFSNTFFDLTTTPASPDLAAIFFEGNPSGATVSVQGNRFLNNDFFGVAIHPSDLGSYTVDASNNWWNGNDGPSDYGLVDYAPGTGTLVGTYINFSPWSEYESVVPWSQGFEAGTGGWYDYGDGTISQVASPFASPFGAIPSPDGSANLAIVSTNSMAASVFTRFSGYSDWLPTGGYTAELDVYLDPAWSVNEGYAYSVASTGTDNEHIQDFIFHISSQPNGLWIAANNNAQPPISQTLSDHEITSAGWYTLQHIFKENTAGDLLEVEMNLLNSGGGVEYSWTSGGPDNYIPAITGGNRYGWFPAMSSGVDFAIDNAELCLGTSGCSPIDTSMTFQPAAPVQVCGPTDRVTLFLNNLTDAYSYQFDISYDASKVVADINFENSFFDTDPPPPDSAFKTIVDSPLGTVQVIAGKLGQDQGVNGSGPILTIDMDQLSAGSFDLIVSGIQVAESYDGLLLPLASPTVTIPVEVCDYGTVDIDGQVNLQGRFSPFANNDSFAIVVDLIDLDGNFGPYSAVVDQSDGSYEFTGVDTLTGGSDYRFEAARPLYLSNEYEPGTAVVTPGTYTAPTTRLLGGDANLDLLVDILDVGCIGGNFGPSFGLCGASAPFGRSDINDDLITNVQDLAIAGGNFTFVSFLPW